MKKKITCAILSFLLVVSTFPLFASAANIVSWGSDTLNTDYNPFNLIIGSDGSSYVGSEERSSAKGIIKYKPDGTKDTGFNASSLNGYECNGMCFTSNGDILTGDCMLNHAPSGLVLVNHTTGTASPVISGIRVNGVAIDSSGNVYVNTGTELRKYNSSYQLQWSVDSTSRELGFCLLNDGSFITANQGNGTVIKYKNDGTLDASFGTDGKLKVSDYPIGYVSFTDGKIYVACYMDDPGDVKQISVDGKEVSTVYSGGQPTLLYAKSGYYYTPNYSDKTITRFPIPGTSNTFNCSASSTNVTPGSTDSITLNVTSDSSSAYRVTAKLFNKSTGEQLTGAAATTATLSEGNAAVTLTPPSGGWPQGDYSVQLYITSLSGGIALGNTIDTNTTISVTTSNSNTGGNAGSNAGSNTSGNAGGNANSNVTSLSATSGSITATATGIDGTVFDPNTTLVVQNVTSQLTASQRNQYAQATKIASSGHSLVQLYDVKMLLNGAPVSPNGKVQVKIKLSDDMANYSDLQMVYIDDSGNVTAIPSTVSDGYITFVTTHFSNYGVIGIPKSTRNPKTGNNDSPLVPICAMALAGIVAAIVLHRKNTNKTNNI